jgi:hypothetical protein
MTTTPRAGPFYDNAQSMGSISLMLQLIRESHRYEAAQKNKRKPSCSSEFINACIVFECYAKSSRVLLDAYSRRHEAQKIYLRQAAAQRWIGWRDHVLQGQMPQTEHSEQLVACDAQLRVVSSIKRSSFPGVLTTRSRFSNLIRSGTRSHHRRLDLLRYEVVRLSIGALDVRGSALTTGPEMGQSEALNWFRPLY